MTIISAHTRPPAPPPPSTQVLRVCNSLLLSDRHVRALGPAAALQLQARHYSVTPLGKRCGLIQWVGHTTSLFGMFKSWQRSTMDRHAAMVAARLEGRSLLPQQQATSGDAAAAAAAAGGEPAAAAAAAAAAAGIPPPPALASYHRPSDLFYARLLSALQVTPPLLSLHVRPP